MVEASIAICMAILQKPLIIYKSDSPSVPLHLRCATRLLSNGKLRVELTLIAVGIGQLCQIETLTSKTGSLLNLKIQLHATGGCAVPLKFFDYFTEDFFFQIFVAWKQLDEWIRNGRNIRQDLLGGCP